VCVVCGHQANERCQWASLVFPCCSPQCVDVVADYITTAVQIFIAWEIKELSGLTHMEREAVKAARQSLYDALVKIGVAGAFDHCTAELPGDVCARRVAYAWRGETGEPIQGRALRIFETGHVLERLLAKWIERAGFDLRTIDPETGEQYAFKDGSVEGHADGIIVGGPSLGFKYPVLWDAKGLNDRSWNQIVKSGLRAASPIYYGQANLYMGYLDLSACLFSALNKNTSELYHELIPINLAEAQRLVDLAVDIVRGWLPPRLGIASTRVCGYCQFQSLCWGGPYDH